MTAKQKTVVPKGANPIMAEIPNSDDQRHAELGGSSADIWLHCHGWRLLMEKVPPKDPTIYMEEGTCMHSVAALCLRPLVEGLPPLNAADFLGATYTRKKGEKIIFDEDMAEAVQKYIDYIVDIVSTFSGSPTIRVECELSLEKIYRGMFGSADFLIVDEDGKSAILLDFKGGRGWNVDGTNNPQMAYYAVGVLLEFPKIESVLTIIFQPRLPDDGEDFPEERAVKEHLFTRKDLVDWGLRFREAAEASYKEDAKACVGEWCDKDCKANAVCKAKEEKNVSLAQQYFKGDIRSDGAEMLPPEQMSPKDLLEFMKLAGRIKKWVSSVESFIQEQANSGNIPEGMKLVEGKKGNRKWADLFIATSALKNNLELSDDDIYTSELKSPNQIEKLVGKKNCKLLFERITTRENGKPILVPADDPRPAVTVGNPFAGHLE